MQRWILLALAIFLGATFGLPGRALAAPIAEVIGWNSVDPPFDFGITATVTGFLLISDEQMAVSYSESLRLINLGTYALEVDQPPDASDDHGTTGKIAAIAYDKPARADPRVAGGRRPPHLHPLHHHRPAGADRRGRGGGARPHRLRPGRQRRLHRRQRE